MNSTVIGDDDAYAYWLAKAKLYQRLNIGAVVLEDLEEPLLLSPWGLPGPAGLRCELELFATWAAGWTTAFGRASAMRVFDTVRAAFA